MLPDFTDEGVLPEGDHELSIAELRESILVTGCKHCDPGWDSAWRAKLVDNLEIVAIQLWTVGINEIFIAGSFVENANHPNDIDGYFVCDLMDYVSGNLQKR